MDLNEIDKGNNLKICIHTLYLIKIMYTVSDYLITRVAYPKSILISSETGLK